MGRWLKGLAVKTKLNKQTCLGQPQVQTPPQLAKLTLTMAGEFGGIFPEVLVLQAHRI